MTSLNEHCSICFLLILCSLLQCIHCQTSESDCEATQFECNDGTCIPGTWECDYENDCSDAEDEDNCDPCESIGYNCHVSDIAGGVAGRCIAPQWKCDNWTDCTLNDDELFCKECDTNTQFECYLDSIDSSYVQDRNNRASGECIDKSKYCDYRQDCYHGEDEPDDCPSCWSEGYVCDHNATCISNNFVCDGILDCGDFSDECECDEDLLINYTLPSQCITNGTSPPTLSPTEEVINVEFSYCPENKLFLGFLTYNDTDTLLNPSLKNNSSNSSSNSIEAPTTESIGNNNNIVTPNKTRVFWTEPRLASDIDLSLIDIESQGHESGDLFGAGFHRFQYVANTKSGPNYFDSCTYNILVIDFAKESVISQCSKETKVSWSFLIDKYTHKVLSYTIDDTIAKVDYEESIYYLPDVRGAVCTAIIALDDSSGNGNGNGNNNKNNDEFVTSVVNWIDNHWIVAIGGLAAIIFLIVILCCAVFYFARKHVEYKEYDAAADDEDLTDDDEDNDESLTEEDNEYETMKHNSTFRTPTGNGIPSHSHLHSHSHTHSHRHPHQHQPPQHQRQASAISQLSQLSRVSGSGSDNNNSGMNGNGNGNRNGNRNGSNGYPMIPIDRRKGNGDKRGQRGDSQRSISSIARQSSNSPHSNSMHVDLHPHLQAQIQMQRHGRPIHSAHASHAGGGHSSGQGRGAVPLYHQGMGGAMNNNNNNNNSNSNVMKPLTRRRSVLGIDIDNLNSGANDLVDDNDEDNEDAQLLADEWNNHDKRNNNNKNSNNNRSNTSKKNNNSGNSRGGIQNGVMRDDSSSDDDDDDDDDSDSQSQTETATATETTRLHN